MGDLSSIWSEAAAYENKVVESSTKQPKVGDDPNMLKLAANCTYSVRLVFHIPPGSKRKSPFINKESHGNYAASSWRVVCPTSEYLSGSAGFKMCPICAETNKWWEQHKTGSLSAKSNYDTYRREFNGYVVVYVISNSNNPEHNGKFKILKYKKEAADFFKWEIFGRRPKQDAVNEDSIGIKAFDFNDGYDLHITTASKTFTNGKGESVEYAKPQFKFARKSTKVNISQDAIEKALELLKFDEKFFEPFDMEKSMKFVNEVMLPNTIASIPVMDIPDPDSMESAESRDYVDADDLVPPQPQTKTVVVEATKPSVVEATKPATQTQPAKPAAARSQTPPTSNDMDDIESIMSMLSEIGK
jgi:hypothetical protein